MDETTRRRALSGELGAEVQRLALAEITTAIPPSLLSPRQKTVAIIVAVLLIASIIALVALRFALPASLARRAAGH